MIITINSSINCFSRKLSDTIHGDCFTCRCFQILTFVLLKIVFILWDKGNRAKCYKQLKQLPSSRGFPPSMIRSVFYNQILFGLKTKTKQNYVRVYIEHNSNETWERFQNSPSLISIWMKCIDVSFIKT